MVDGTTKRIADIQVGDQVLSRDPATGKDEAKTVTFTIELHAPSVVDVTMRDARTGKAETLTCTPEHPLFVQGQGWVEAGSVGIGSSIVSRAGPALEVTDLTWEKNKAEELAAGTGSSFGGYTVYNLTVEGDHTFFVGAAGGGTWVHNSCDLTGFRRTHILNRHMSGAGKSEFPASWNGDDITTAISDVATAPASTRGIGPYNSPFATGTRNGVDIRVDFYPSGHPTYDGMISTGYPTNMPMNP